jgi:hypothetical protein
MANRWLIQTKNEDGSWEDQQTLPFQDDAVELAFSYTQYDMMPGRVVDCKTHRVIWGEGEWCDEPT